METQSNRPKVGVGVFIVRDGKILLGKRIGPHGTDTWSPPGGHLEFGETWEECARRETLEEAGVRITNVRFASVTNDVFHEEGRHYVTINMVAEFEDGEPVVLEPEKCETWGWFAWEEFPEALFLPVVNLRTTEFHPLRA